MTNYTRTEGAPHLSLDTEVTIGYSTPWRQVHALLIIAAERTGMVLRDPPPHVLQRALEDFYVRYQLIVAVDCRAIPAVVLGALLGNIQDLDFEYKCGKLSEADYTQVRREMAGEVAQVLEHIHHIEKSLDLDALIRREVSARKEPSQKKPGIACPSCGSNNPTKNKFCAECGAKLNG